MDAYEDQIEWLKSNQTQDMEYLGFLLEQHARTRKMYAEMGLGDFPEGEEITSYRQKLAQNGQKIDELLHKQQEANQAFQLRRQNAELMYDRFNQGRLQPGDMVSKEFVFRKLNDDFVNRGDLRSLGNAEIYDFMKMFERVKSDYRRTSGDAGMVADNVCMQVDMAILCARQVLLDRNALQAMEASRKAEAELQETEALWGSGRKQKNTSGQVCSTCHGKGYIKDINPLGHKDERSRSRTKERGWFDLLFYGGGNVKDCPACNKNGDNPIYY